MNSKNSEFTTSILLPEKHNHYLLGNQSAKCLFLLLPGIILALIRGSIIWASLQLEQPKARSIYLMHRQLLISNMAVFPW